MLASGPPVESVPGPTRCCCDHSLQTWRSLKHECEHNPLCIVYVLGHPTIQSRHLQLYCLCRRDIQNFIVCAVATFKTLLFVQSVTFKTLLFVQSRHSKLYCLCSRDIQNFIVCAVATFKTLLFVQSRHSKLYCLCNRNIQNFIVCAVEPFETFLVCVSLSGAPYKTVRQSKN